MFETDPTRWAYSTWLLYVLGLLFLVGFLVFYPRFELAERRAKRQGGDAVLQYNSLIRGFPNAVYAKMFGKRAFEVAKPDDARTQ